MEDSNKVCRICLNVISDPVYFQNLDCIMGKLQTVVPDMQIQLDSLVMCNRCYGLLNDIYDFKYNCLNVEEIILLRVSTIKSNLKFNLCDIMQWTDNIPELSKNNIRTSTCRTCLRLHEHFGQNMDENLVTLLKTCVPELDMDLTLKPDICEVCVKILCKWNDFQATYLKTEELIKHYSSTHINSEIIHINELLEFAEVFNWERIGITEYNPMQNNVEMKFDCSETALQTPAEKIKNEDQTEDITQDKKIKIILQESIETVLKPRERNGIRMYTCPKCRKVVKDMDSHLGEHGDNLKLNYQCYKCNYRNKSKKKLKEHLLLHKLRVPVPDKPYKCDQCSFQARQKGNLMTHLLVHKSPGEIKMFDCHLCKFQARQKGNLKTHLLTHKKKEDICMFKCNNCKYQARQKGNLRTHMLKKHKLFKETALEALFFKCSKCSYKVKHKPSLKKHMRTHSS